jgi:DNA-binding response OmpR family regulator
VIDATTPFAKSDQPPLVLVADDDAEIGHLVAEVVGRLGLGSVVARDGAAAVRLAAAHKLRLCCAILDVQMPRLGGIQAAQEIRQFAPDLSIVLMSAAFPTNYETRIAPLRIAHVLPKPFHLSELIALLGPFIGAPPAL